MAEAEQQQVEDTSVADAIRAAMAEHEPPAEEEQAAAEAEPVAEPEGEDTAEEVEEAPSLPLKAREGEEEAEEAAEKPVEEAETEVEEAEEVILPPASWSKDDRKVFEGLDRSAQEVIARRETERDRATRSTVGDLAPLKAVTEEFQDYFRQIGVTPEQSFRGLIAAEQSLRFGTPLQKAEALQQIARSYGIDMPAQPGPGGQLQEQEAFTDPEVQALRTEFGGQLGEIKELLSSRQQQEEQAKQSAVEQTVAAFFDKLESVDPKAMPEARYAAEVMPQFEQMVQADRRNGTPDVDRLMQLYRSAAWATDSVREKIQADQAAQAQAEAKRVTKTVRKQSSSASGGTAASAHSEDLPANESVRDSVQRAMGQIDRAQGGLR